MEVDPAHRPGSSVETADLATAFGGRTGTASVGGVERIERSAWIGVALLGLVMGGLSLAEGAWVAALLIVAGTLGAAWWMAPWRGRGVRHDELTSIPADQRRVVVYWRPGCAYCSRLRMALGRHRNDVVWVNIWRDPAAETYVREVNAGDAVVPTVVIDGEATTNPDPARVLSQLT